MVSVSYDGGQDFNSPPSGDPGGAGSPVAAAPLDLPPVTAFPPVGMLTAHGSRDSHAVTLSHGSRNGSPRAGAPYGTVTWADIRAMADSPAATPKEDAQFVVLSSYVGCDGRTHAVQRDRGMFHGLAVDIDKGDHSGEDVLAAVQAVVGGSHALIYSSSSAAPDSRKWRVLLPLSAPIAGGDYPDTQLALFAMLGHHGLACDETLSRCGQPIYLPNVPPKRRRPDGQPVFYQRHYVGGAALDLRPDHPIVVMRESIRKQRVDAAAAAAVRAQDHTAQRLAHVAATGDDFDPIRHFNAHHSVGEMLVRYGFVRRERGNGSHWRSPLSTSGSYSTEDRGDYWITVSNWAAAHGVGRPTSSGFRSGDAFDLYAFFEYGNDKRAAVLAYADEVRPRDDLGGGSRAVLEKPPAPSGDIRPLADYRTDLVAGVTAAVAIPGLHLFRAPTGSGKSTATATALRGVTNWLMVLPDHANVQERVADLIGAGIEAVAYPKATADNCGNLEEFNRVQRLGLVAGAVLCPSCPFKDGCLYREAVKAADDAPGRVGTHERLRRSASAAADAQVVVIDEAPEAVIAPTLTVRVEAVMQVDGLARAIRDHWYSTANDDQRGFADAMLQVVEAVNRTCVGIGGVGRTAVPLEAIGGVPDNWQRQLYRAIRQQGIGNLDADAVQLVTRAAAGDLLSLEVVTDATERAVGGEDGQQRVDRRLHHYLVGRWRPAIPGGASVIMLDATSDADNVAAVAGKPVADRTPAGRLEGAHAIVQVADDITRGTSSRTVAGIVDAFLADNPTVTRLGIIGHQHHIRDLVGADDAPGLLGSQLGRLAMSCWFGAGPDRASNRWHVDCDHVLVLGTPRINPGEYRRWLVGHGLEDAAQLEDGGWVPRPWEGTTVDGQSVVVHRGGYQDASWDRAYRSTTAAALMQAVGRGRSLLAEGVPVTVITNEPLGLPIRTPVDATPAAIRETVDVVTRLVDGGQPSAKSPIGNPYRGNCASAVPRAQVVTALVEQLGIGRRAAQLRVAAAIAGGRLVTADRPGWVQVSGCGPQATRKPQEAPTAAPATSDVPALVVPPAVTLGAVSLPPLENVDERVPSGKERGATPPVIEVVTPVLVAHQPPVVITADTPVPPLVDLMELVEERAAMLEYDGGLDRLEADRRARMSYGLPVIDQLDVDDDQQLVVGADHGAVAARSIPFVAAVLERFPGVVKRVMPAPRIVPRSDQPATADRCSCGCVDTVVVVIHGGKSTRLDCARCDRFRRFGHWYDRVDGPGPGLPVPPSGDLRAVDNNPVVRTVAAGPGNQPGGGGDLRSDKEPRVVWPPAITYDAIIPGAVIGTFLPTGMG